MYKRILSDSTHFQDICESVRSINIAWDAILRTNEITELDATNLKIIELEIKRQISQKLEKAKKEEENQDEDVQVDKLNISSSVVQSIVHVLGTTDNKDVRKVVSYILATLLLNDQYNEAVSVFESDQSLVEKLFENILQGKDDLQTNTINAFNIVSLLVQDQLVDADIVAKLLSNEQFISILQNVEQMDTSYVIIRLLQELATIKKYRSIIWLNEKQLLPTVFNIIEKPISKENSGLNSSNGNVIDSNKKLFVNTNVNNLGIQLQYYSLLLIWLLTFDNKIIFALVENYLDKILNLLKLVKITIKEKISRLCISIILQICLPDGQKENKKFIKNLILLSNGISTVLSLIERKYSDEELRNDLIKLKEILENEYTELTTFDEYLAELDSKLLCWSPPHINNSFWVDNIDNFKKDNWKIFKKLINLLFEIQNDSKDSNNIKETNIKLQVLLNDITHIIELIPDESINVLNKLNGKVVIMELLNHNDSRVKFEALKATQSIIGYTFK